MAGDDGVWVLLGLAGDGGRQASTLAPPATQRAANVASALRESELRVVVIDKHGGITVRFACVIFATRYIPSTKALQNYRRVGTVLTS